MFAFSALQEQIWMHSCICARWLEMHTCFQLMLLSSLSPCKAYRSIFYSWVFSVEGSELHQEVQINDTHRAPTNCYRYEIIGLFLAWDWDKKEQGHPESSSVHFPGHQNSKQKLSRQEKKNHFYKSLIIYRINRLILFILMARDKCKPAPHWPHYIILKAHASSLGIGIVMSAT